MVRINSEKTKHANSSSATKLAGTLAKQKAAFKNAPNPPWMERKAKLQKLSALIKAHEADFIKAISEDFGHRAAEETIMAEILVIQGGLVMLSSIRP